MVSNINSVNLLRLRNFQDLRRSIGEIVWQTNFLKSHLLCYLFLLLVAPRRFSNVSGEHFFKERDDVELYCGASGKPAPNITWPRVFENGSESQVLHIGATWNIVRIKRTDAGKYRCTAKNEVASPVSYTIAVNVLCECV